MGGMRAQHYLAGAARVGYCLAAGSTAHLDPQNAPAGQRPVALWTRQYPLIEGGLGWHLAPTPEILTERLLARCVNPEMLTEPLLGRCVRSRLEFNSLAKQASLRLLACPDLNCGTSSPRQYSLSLLQNEMAPAQKLAADMLFFSFPFSAMSRDEATAYRRRARPNLHTLLPD